MGTLGGAGADGLSDLIALAFPITNDGSIPQQKDNDQATVEALLKQRMFDSVGWQRAHRSGFSGLPSNMPFGLGIIAKLAEQFTGRPVSDWVDQWQEHPILDGLQDIVQDALAAIFRTAANIQSLFSNLDFSDLEFEPIAALREWINDMLNEIPHRNILGLGGPGTLGATIESTWDHWIGGLVGTVGTGAGLADLFNIGYLFSSRASLGQYSWDVLGIRSNKPFWGGMLPTGVSNIPLPSMHTSTIPTFALTQSTAIMGYHRIDESSPKGVVSWQGYGTTNITHFFVNIYQVAEDGVHTLVHASANIIADVSGSSTDLVNIYEMPTSLAVVATETYGIEYAIRGAGTHNIVGATSWVTSHPTVYPKRPASVRNSGTGAPPASIAAGSVVYTSNVPFTEFAISGGVYDSHDPVSRSFTAVGTTSVPIPSWADFVDVIVLGGGGGGHVGGTIGIGGEGGDNGQWAADTWERGVDYTGTVSVVAVVGGGGTGGPNEGDDGSPTTVSVPGHTIIGAGGVGANSFDILGFEHFGESPGNLTYGGITYVGGEQQNIYGEDGAAPGGGGSGGNWLLFQGGGDGAPGAAWVRFRQV